MADVLDRDFAPRKSGGFDRVPPQNLEAEQATLGAMFLSAEAAEGALAMLRSDDFIRPGERHVNIFLRSS